MHLLSFVLNSSLLRIQAYQLVQKWFLFLCKYPKFLISVLTNLGVNFGKVLAWMSLKSVVLPDHKMHCSYLQVHSVFLKSIFCTTSPLAASHWFWLENALLYRAWNCKHCSTIAAPLQHHFSAQEHCTAGQCQQWWVPQGSHAAVWVAPSLRGALGSGNPVLSQCSLVRGKEKTF